MEENTPPMCEGAPSMRSQLAPLPCDLSEMMDDDDFSFGVPVSSLPPLPDTDAEDDEEHDAEDEVCTRTCYCQASPKDMPRNYTPCCLPLGVLLARREIQMFPEFKGNLLRMKGEPAKTQTFRRWGVERARAHKLSYSDGKWIRVWRGQGHKDTIGWLLITFWDEVKVHAITKGDCVREGRPTWEPEMFREKYCKGLSPKSTLIRVKFDFRACRTCMGQ